MRTALTSAVLVAALACTAFLSRPPADPYRGNYLAPLLPRIELLKVLGAGQQSLVTDYYWLQAIQAAGKAGEIEQAANAQRWLDLYYYADLVTRLDPKFYKVYVYAGNAIPTNLGREHYVNTEEAISLLERGVENFPDDWRLNLYLASHLSYFRHDHLRAAKLLEHAARQPDAPSGVKFLASRFLAFAGKFDAALAFADAAEEDYSDPRLRSYFEARKKELEQERILRKVDAAIDAFKAREGRMPNGIGELVSRGDLPSIPSDPMEGVFYIGEDGRSHSSAAPARLEMETAEKRRKEKYGDEP